MDRLTAGASIAALVSFWFLEPCRMVVVVRTNVSVEVGREASALTDAAALMEANVRVMPCD